MVNFCVLFLFMNLDVIKGILCVCVWVCVCVWRVEHIYTQMVYNDNRFLEFFPLSASGSQVAGGSAMARLRLRVQMVVDLEVESVLVEEY